MPIPPCSTELNYTVTVDGVPTPWHTIPQHLRPGLDRWIMDGQPPGDFLQAVFRNDLQLAVCHADPVSLQYLREICLFLHNNAPPDSHGSAGIAVAWEKDGGLNGRKRHEAAA